MCMSTNMYTAHAVLVLKHWWQVFDFDVSHIHWPTYLENYCLGVKRFALHEDVSRLPLARQSINRYFLLLLLLHWMYRAESAYAPVWCMSFHLSICPICLHLDWLTRGSTQCNQLYVPAHLLSVRVPCHKAAPANPDMLEADKGKWQRDEWWCTWRHTAKIENFNIFTLWILTNFCQLMFLVWCTLMFNITKMLQCTSYHGDLVKVFIEALCECHFLRWW